jgi:endonuclease YncB( thermonuclease family)
LIGFLCILDMDSELKKAECLLGALAWCSDEYQYDALLSMIRQTLEPYVRDSHPRALWLKSSMPNLGLDVVLSEEDFLSEYTELVRLAAGSNAFLKVYDGDSLNVRTRLAHIDTPEIKGQCEFEIQLAKKARDYSQNFIKTHKSIEIKTVGVGRHGRPLVEIRSEGRYLNQELVEAGLARVYKGKRESWCR